MVSSFIDKPCIAQHIRPGARQLVRQGPDYEVKYPALDATLWRYMDVAKFADLLESEALFFARANKLDDPFEGSWPDANHKEIEQDTNITTTVHGGRPEVLRPRADLARSLPDICQP